MTSPSWRMAPCPYWSARASTCQATTVSTSPAPIALSTRKASDSLKAVVRKSLPSAVTDHISRASNGMQQRRLEIPVDLGAQARDMHVDHIGLRIEMIVPDVFEQHGARDHFAGVLHEIFEQPEFARLQDDFLPCPRHFMREPVEFEVAQAIEGLFARPLGMAARQHFNARQQFGKGIGLGEVIAAAGSEPLDAVVDLAERQKDQHRRLDILRAQ